ncbi:17596_t:CDS:2, partial [Funneliformis caledonium]
NIDNVQIDVDNISVYDDSNNDDLSNVSDNADNFSIYNKLVENDEAVNIVKRLQEAAKKYYQKHTYHKGRRLCYINTFWSTKKSTEDINVEIDNSTNIKKENTNSEIWMCLNSICLYLPLVKNNYSKIEASNIVTDVAGKKDIILKFGAFFGMRISSF